MWRVTFEGVTLEMKVEVSCFGSQLKTLFYLTNDFLPVLHLHHKCALNFQECDVVFVWVTKVELDEAYPIFGQDVEFNVQWIGIFCTKVDVHCAKSLKTCPLSVFESFVEAYADVETIREAGFLIHLLMTRKLGEM